jgi:hypothetical protein
MSTEPLFRRGLGFVPAPGRLPRAAEPSETTIALNRAYDEVNTLGGSDATPSAKPYEAGFTSGFGRAIDDVLAVLEQLGAEAPAQRLEHETP